MKASNEVRTISGYLSRWAACAAALSIFVLMLGVQAAFAAPPPTHAICYLDNPMLPPGACCTERPPLYYCIYSGGIDQGPWTSCQGVEACCLPDGTCLSDVDAICCDDLGGLPEGEGTDCFPNPCAIRACCLPGPSRDDDFCEDLPSSACEDQGGIPQAEGTTCAGLLAEDYDSDGVSDACDNCWKIPNSDQLDTDQDLRGNVCDNCPTVPNYDQSDSDECIGGDNDGLPCDSTDDCPGGYCHVDGRGDACDNCPNKANGNQMDSDAHCSISGTPCGPTGASNYLYQECPDGEVCITDTTYPDGYPAYGDVCDNCPFDINEHQRDCDADGEGDVCEDLWDDQDDDFDTVCNGVDNCPAIPNEEQDNCDGDEAGDVCDGDIDGDDIVNENDVCDYTPWDWIGYIVTEPTSPWYGTLRGDIDGDCDVDTADEQMFDDLPRTGPGDCKFNDDMDHTEVGCGHCPACDSCCLPPRY